MERDEEDNESVRDNSQILSLFLILFYLLIDIIIHKNNNHDDASEIIWKRFK